MLEKRRNNISIRLKQNLRSRIWHALKKGNKKENFQELIGCTTDFLKTYLEKLFKEGMNWENYGARWHIDHIIPCCKFDLTIKQQRIECFNYKNLQPLFAEDNLKKNKF